MTGIAPSSAFQATSPAAFHDAESASLWLAEQPQANMPAMLSSLRAEIEVFNLLDVSPRRRLKTLEVLRKAAFTVGLDCRRRCEGKPLPLATAERSALDAARHLWRSYAVGYEICLQACLDGDASLSKHAARVAHRVSFCLRAEQLTCYAGGVLPEPGFWKSFHALFLAAESLGCASVMEEDGLLGETRASSVSGQYAMALMLHLARPFSLSCGQLATAARWLARWRELARIEPSEDLDARYWPIPLDLATDGPIPENGNEDGIPRWLSLDGVLRKIRRRIDALSAGELPENLKLGGGFPAKDCAALLETLADRLQRPPPAVPADTAALPEISVGIGLAAIHRLLGGEKMKEALRSPPPLADDHLSAEQLAVFGRVVRETRPDAEAEVKVELERWRQAQWERGERGGLTLARPPGNGTSRLALRGLLAIDRKEGGYLLAIIDGLWQGGDETLFCTAVPFAGDVTPRVAEIRNWTTGEVTRHPAIQIARSEDRAYDCLLLPAGVLVRASGVRFFDGEGELLFGLRVSDCLERGGGVELWRAPDND
ncbi:MAG: hypothetical protein LBI87_10595 [Candidatus Accumulibacter sp.]|jgi:hypothetical protein|nr:hypothetical protein [Accumulibacter sp.]